MKKKRIVKIVKPRAGRRKQILAAKSWGEQTTIALYGRPLSPVERLTQRVWALKAIEDDDPVAWAAVKNSFVEMFFPALVGDDRPAFKKLIEAMQWANINIKNPPGPGKSRAATLRYQLLAMSQTTFNSPRATRKLLERRGFTDFEDQEIYRAKQDILRRLQ